MKKLNIYFSYCLMFCTMILVSLPAMGVPRLICPAGTTAYQQDAQGGIPDGMFGSKTECWQACANAWQSSVQECSNYCSSLHYGSSSTVTVGTSTCESMCEFPSGFCGSMGINCPPEIAPGSPYFYWVFTPVCCCGEPG